MKNKLKKIIGIICFATIVLFFVLLITFAVISGDGMAKFLVGMGVFIVLCFGAIWGLSRK